MKEDLLKIIKHYGVNAQQRKLAEEVKIEHVCDATRILAQYEEWLKEGINYKYGKWTRYSCLKFFNKLQEIKKRIVNEKIQNNQK